VHNEIYLSLELRDAIVACLNVSGRFFDRDRDRDLRFIDRDRDLCFNEGDPFLRIPFRGTSFLILYEKSNSFLSDLIKFILMSVLLKLYIIPFVIPPPLLNPCLFKNIRSSFLLYGETNK
jgi:hypothetical protein